MTLLGVAIFSCLMIRAGLDNFKAAVIHAGIFYIVIIVCIFSVSQLLRILRWKVLLHPVVAIPFLDVAKICFASNVANNILPVKAGDLIRALALNRRHGVNMAFGVTSVLFERIIDGLIILLLLSVASLYVPVAASYKDTLHNIFMLSLIFFVGLFGLIIAIKQSPATLLFLSRPVALLPENMRNKASNVVAEVQASMMFIRSDILFLLFIVVSILVWVLEGLTFWIGFIAFSVGGSIAKGFFVYCITNLAGVIPSTPGNVGVYQAAVLLAFYMLSMPLNACIAFSTTIQFVQILIASLPGIFTLRLLSVRTVLPLLPENTVTRTMTTVDETKTL
jgi:hypothetical protein